MPQLENEYAIHWTVETEHITIFEDHRETALFTRDLSGKGIGSNKYKTCREPMGQAVTSDVSSLTLLYFGNVMDTIEVCNPEPVTLRSKERATKMGYGSWLIISP